MGDLNEFKQIYIIYIQDVARKYPHDFASISEKNIFTMSSRSNFQSTINCNIKNFQVTFLIINE